MKKWLLFCFIVGLGVQVSGQKSYVDLFKLTHAYVPANEFSNPNKTTSIRNSVFVSTIPFLLKDSSVLITGLDYAQHQLKLDPAVDASKLNLVTFKFGYQFQINKKWSSRLMFTPKLAGDFHTLNNTLQLGGTLLFLNKINKQSMWYFGGYLNNDLFSLFTTPVAGYYFISKNKRFEVDVMAPIIGHADYKIYKDLRFGLDFLTVVRSYQLNQPSNSSFYVHNAFNEYGCYVQMDALKSRLILQAKIVLTDHDYALYQDGDNVSFGITGNYINDRRLRINPEFENSVGCRFSVIYRFLLNN